MPAAGPGEEANAANQTGNVMNKRRHVFELHVQDKMGASQPGGEFANYLRENSDVKAHRYQTACTGLPALPMRMRFGFVW